MTDYGLPLLTVDVSPTLGAEPSFTYSPSTVPAATPAALDTEWVVQSVHWNGTTWVVDQVFATAIVGSVRFGLNVPAQVDFDVPMETDLTDLPLGREVQVYRNGHLLLFGPCVTRRCNTADRVWNYTAYDPLWYLTHRYFGEANRKNYLKNGSFDTDLTYWSTVGSLTSATADNAIRLLGAKSMRLAATTSGESYMRQSVTITAGAVGLAVFATAWVYVDSITAGATLNRGLVIGGPDSSATYTIDDKHVLQQWTRVSEYVTIPPNTTQVIQVRLYSPHGVVHWDAVTLTVDESLSFTAGTSGDGGGWTQEEIAVYTLRYLSGRLPVGTPYTKSNLRIGDAIYNPSGIIKERTYKFSDHQVGYAGGAGGGGLDEWPQAADGFDFRIISTPTSRTFKTYWPALGFDHTGVPWVLKRSLVAGEIAGVNYAVVKVEMGDTIEGTATDVTIMGGWGTGSGREEGGSSDPAGIDGTTYELVESAPNQAPIDSLTEIATARRTQLARVLSTPVLTVVEPRDAGTNEVAEVLIGVIMPGDLIALLVDDFSVQINGGDNNTPLVVRVTQVTINPADETLTVAVAV